MLHPSISHARIQRVAVSVDTQAANELVAAVTGARIRLISGFLMSAGIVGAKFQSGSTDLSGSLPLVAQSTLSLNEAQWGQVETAEGAALNLTLDAATAVTGWITYQVVGQSQFTSV